MKKSIKITFMIVGILIGIILLDTLQARIFKHSPIISFKEELADNDSWVDKGILMDTYYCSKEKDIITVSWKFKGSKFTCPVDNIVTELNRVNIKIIEYFSSDNVEYDNLSFNYIDAINNVVIVGLLDNSKEAQEKFKKLVVDSDLIQFVSGEQHVDHTILEDLSVIQDKIVENVSLKENYTNFASCYIDYDNNVVVVELIDNSESKQGWFRRNILDSKYIKFTQGGPYTTSKPE